MKDFELSQRRKALITPCELEKIKKFKKFGIDPRTEGKEAYTPVPLNNLNYLSYFILYIYIRVLGVRDRSRSFKIVQNSLPSK